MKEKSLTGSIMWHVHSDQSFVARVTYPEFT